MAPFFDSRCIYNLPHHDAFFHVLHFQRRHWWVIGPQSCGQSEKPTHIQPRRRYMAVASDIDVLVGEKRAYYYYYYYYYGIVAGTVVLMCGNWKSISTHSCYLKIAIKHATASYREDNVTSTPTFYTSLTNIDVSDAVKWRCSNLWSQYDLCVVGNTAYCMKLNGEELSRYSNKLNQLV